MDMLDKLIYEGLKAELRAARKEVNRKPTEGQKKAGNYKMGHINYNGFQITIENPKNSTRSGVDGNGKKWSTKMYNDYGYFVKTLGRDGDAIDVFLGNNPKSKYVFVVDQKVNGAFDESKVMMGFDTEKEAKDAYLSNYEKDWKGFWKITQVDIPTFKQWLYDGYKQRKPFFQYKEIESNKLNETMMINNNQLKQIIKESVKMVLNEKFSHWSSPKLVDIIKQHGMPRHSRIGTNYMLTKLKDENIEGLSNERYPHCEKGIEYIELGDGTIEKIIL